MLGDVWSLSGPLIFLVLCLDSMLPLLYPPFLFSCNFPVPTFLLHGVFGTLQALA
jgi:hypothetical protein